MASNVNILEVWTLVAHFQFRHLLGMSVAVFLQTDGRDELDERVPPCSPVCKRAVISTLSRSGQRHRWTLVQGRVCEPCRAAGWGPPFFGVPHFVGSPWQAQPSTMGGEPASPQSLYASSPGVDSASP